MGYLISRRTNANISYNGTQYLNPEVGTRKLCIRTGTKPEDVIKYGLTSNSSASSYCGMRMFVDGNVAYIGRYEPTVAQIKTSTTWYTTLANSNSYLGNTTTYSRTYSLGNRTTSSTRYVSGVTSSRSYTANFVTEQQSISRTGRYTSRMPYIVSVSQTSNGRIYSERTASAVSNIFTYSFYDSVRYYPSVTSNHNFNL